MDRQDRIARLEAAIEHLTPLKGFDVFDAVLTSLQVALRCERLEHACVLSRHAIRLANEKLGEESISRKVALKRIDELLPEDEDVSFSS